MVANIPVLSLTSTVKWLQRRISKRIFCLNKTNRQFISTTGYLMKDDVSLSPKKFSLGFEEYQQQRRKMRNQKRISGIPFGVIGLTASSMVSVMMNPNMFDATDPEQIQPILGLDPLVFCTICGVASSAAGYMIGCTLYGVVWQWMNKDLAQKLLERETDFLQRLEKHRTDAFSKFEDDFYGESIKTLSDYRQWVRQMQRKKRDEEKFGKTIVNAKDTEVAY
ncbi:presequence translocated-associated motor subunit PAM17, mitochondrial-like [Xenia sp. Carnegie-2017]|uniref:presequence translocated-associated motor subunit PAM17, mitochondrial-like n=1 Tax=Xenia sp. Carnegie-2017 TaxID=2897299 RepID=UPI001F048572|nr:presequence translocated-associated motor subunit PAM17, mitochondrial-like [Xenia sp. Carnegie-2017]